MATNRSKTHTFFSLLGIRIATFKDGERLAVPEISKGFLDLIGCPAIQKLQECQIHITFILNEIQNSKLW